MDEALSTLVPSLAASGVFGSGRYSSLAMDTDSPLAVQFGAVVSLVKVKLCLDSGEVKSVPIVVKVQFPDEHTRKVRDGFTMFSNEVNMYKEVLPFLNTKNVRAYPKCYYAFSSSAKEPDKDVLILENIKYLGFSLPPGKLFLDYNHISLAMRKIGELHAWSYTAKGNDAKKFFSVAEKLKRLTTHKDEAFDFELVVWETIKRGVKPHLESRNDGETLNEFVEVMEPVWSIQDILFDTDDKLGVVLHGDFCKNNVFYSYDSFGKPTDCMYFDFQLSKYGSPAVDLSFFLYMHTDAEMRAKHWDDFLHIYWDAVRDNVPSHIDIPTFEEFLDHFSCRAVYGYIHCSFFAPYMLLEEPMDMKDFETLSSEEKLSAFITTAGEKGEKCLVDIVSHLLERKYIHRFLEYLSKRRV